MAWGLTKRFAGRAETGQQGKTDPLMGSMVQQDDEKDLLLPGLI